MTKIIRNPDNDFSFIAWLPGEKSNFIKNALPTISITDTKCVIHHAQQATCEQRRRFSIKFDPRWSCLPGFLYSDEGDFFEGPLNKIVEAYRFLRLVNGYSPWMSKAAYRYMIDNDLWRQVR